MPSSMKSLLLLGAAVVPAVAGVSVHLLQAGQCGQSELDSRLIAAAAVGVTPGLEMGSCAAEGYTVPIGDTTTGDCPGQRCVQIALYAPTGSTVCSGDQITSLTTACAAFGDATDPNICGTPCEAQARTLMAPGSCFIGGDVHMMLDSIVSVCAGYVAVGDAASSCNSGLYFEAYYNLPAGAFTWQTLADANFDAWTANVAHADHTPDIDFANDAAFVDDIEGFSETDNYLMRLRGHFTADMQGEYTFSTTSDDGSMLYIDNAVVVDNDGLHGAQKRTGTVTLTPGQHSIVITFFENGGSATLQATVTPPNSEEQVLGGDMLSNPFGCGDDMAAVVGANARCAIDYCVDTQDCPMCASGLSCEAPHGAAPCSGACFGTCVAVDSYVCSTCADLGWSAGGNTVCAESDGQNMPGWDSCENEVTQADAETHCMSVGARLCTAEELFENAEGQGTGCGHDGRLIWSSSTTLNSGAYNLRCADFEHVVVPGNVGNMARYGLEPGCVNVGQTGAALRCCADTVCGAQAAPNIVSLAQSVESLSTLVQAVIAGDLVDTLSSPGPFTVFAPNNAAFAALGQAAVSQLLADHARLVDVLTYHVVSGEIHSTDLSSGMSATTVEGGDLRVRIKGGGVTILGGASHARVVQADVQASNGVVHVIDAVLFPSASGH